MRTWFNVRAGANEISIYDEIGLWGVTAKDFITELRALDGSEINLSINSPGGSVMDGIAIYNALRASGKTVNVKVAGIAASIASVIAMAGDRVEMPENTFMMIHNPWTFAMGNAAELRDIADVLDKINSSLVATYVARTGKTEEEIQALLDGETYMTAAEAKEHGFIDEVTPAFKAKASFELDRLPEHVRALFKPTEPATTQIDSMRAAVVAAGLDAHQEAFLLDPKLTTVEALQAALAEALEVQALCAVAKVDAAEHIQARRSLPEVRAAIVEARAAVDEELHIDTAPKQGITQSQPQAQTVTTAGIWAKRHHH